VSLIAVGLAAAVAGGILLIAFGLAMSVSPRQGDLLEARLAQFAEAGRAPATLAEVEMSLPLFDRVMRPFLDKIGNRLNRNKAQGGTDALQEKLNLAGRPWGLNASGFLALRLLLMMLFTAIGFALALFGALTMPLFAAVPAGGLILGYLAPQMVVARRIKKRQKEILLALPSALDLLTISVEAGLSFDAALTRVVEKYNNAFSRELSIMLNEVRLGRPRLEALDDVGRRCRVEELSNFIQAIIQSEQLGVGVANVLRIQSEEIRRKRRQRAEEQGQKAPLKMLFPMVGCIFPTLFIVLLGPAVIEVAHQFGSAH
jgi:tight adherence protein C